MSISECECECVSTCVSFCVSVCEHEGPQPCACPSPSPRRRHPGDGGSVAGLQGPVGGSLHPGAGPPARPQRPRPEGPRSRGRLCCAVSCCWMLPWGCRPARPPPGGQRSALPLSCGSSQDAAGPSRGTSELRQHRASQQRLAGGLAASLARGWSERSLQGARCRGVGSSLPADDLRKAAPGRASPRPCAGPVCLHAVCVSRRFKQRFLSAVAGRGRGRGLQPPGHCQTASWKCPLKVTPLFSSPKPTCAAGEERRCASPWTSPWGSAVSTARRR